MTYDETRGGIDGWFDLLDACGGALPAAIADRGRQSRAVVSGFRRSQMVATIPVTKATVECNEYVSRIDELEVRALISFTAER